MERRQAKNVLELANSETLSPQEDSPVRAMPLDGVMRGVISEFEQTSGTIQVVVPRLSLLEPMVARSTVPITQGDVGKEVIVAFEAGETRVPFIVGLLWQQGQNPPVEANPVEAKVDGDQVLIQGKKEVVLKCGKASITLTRAGKVVIRGTYVLSRSSGVNRVKGGSIQIN